MPRPIAATLHRKVGKTTKALWTRYFVRVTTAFPRAVELAILTSQPGDVIEFHHNELGFLMGTVKLHINNRMTIDWSPLKD